MKHYTIRKQEQRIYQSIKITMRMISDPFKRMQRVLLRINKRMISDPFKRMQRVLFGPHPSYL
jgi:hypothetical protein